MQEPVICSKTPRNIVQVSHVKFQSPKIKKLKIQRQLFQNEIEFPLTIFFKNDFFLGKENKSSIFSLRNLCFLKLELP